MKKLLLLPLAAVIMSGCVLDVSRNGKEIGYIVDAEEHGWIFRNYYIQVKNEQESSAREQYCIPSSQNKLFDKAQTLLEQQKKVRIEYKGVRNIFAIGQCRGYIALDIVEVQ